MRREDIRKLLGGYATGMLTAEERQALFEAALEDQELFDALAKEQPLRDLLEDPAARAHLLAALDDGPLPWPRRLERWLWGHAVGVAAVACFLTVGGYVVWQSRDRRKPTLIAEMQRQSIEVHDSALPDKPAAGSLARRAFDPGAVTKKPGPSAMIESGQPPVAAPPRPAPATLPMARMALLPPPPPAKSDQVQVIAGDRPAQTETVTVSADATLAMTQTSPVSPAPVANPRAAQPVAGRAASGAVGGVLGSVSNSPVLAISPPPGRAQGLSFFDATKGARELYDPALGAPVPKAAAESVPVRASGAGGRGGGGGGAARPRGQADAAPASTATQASLGRLDAAAQPAASPGVRYQVLRQVAGGAFEELAPASDLAAGDAIKLRFIPNYSGYICVFEAGASTGLLQSRVERLATAETPEIRVDQPGRREIYALFAREEQPPLNGANADSFRAKVLQGASAMLSQAAGMEGVYVVNPAPGAPTAVPFIVTLNFK